MAACLSAALALAACEADLQPGSASNDGADGAGGGDPAPTDVAAGTGDVVPETPGTTPVPAPGGAGQAVGNGSYTLRAANRSVGIVEGGEPVTVSIELGRENGYSLPVTLALAGDTPADAADLEWAFADERLEPGETSTELTLELDIGVAPLLPGTRTLSVIGTDGRSAPVSSEIALEVVPTTAPDVYLLVGQSNMDGFSQLDARMAGPGEPDAPDERIFQLNVTGNDRSNFPSAAAFTDPDAIVAEPPYTEALDPLHDGFGAGGKSGERIGPGLSFAKAMLESTTANIVLVPAAWPDTGFCRRGTNILPGIGWLAEPSADEAFAGTLLHDRAVARANRVVTGLDGGGVLRGILWHQGEAEVGDPVCANAYGENLAAMVASFRENIDPGARDERADVPFVLATMSKGTDERGSQLPFPPTKEIIDAVHRNVADIVPFSAVVDADDLVPPAYPCGEGSCVHFGAAALREMGARYAERLRSLTGS